MNIWDMLVSLWAYRLPPANVVLSNYLHYHIDI